MFYYNDSGVLTWYTAYNTTLTMQMSLTLDNSIGTYSNGDSGATLNISGQLGYIANGILSTDKIQNDTITFNFGLDTLSAGFEFVITFSLDGLVSNAQNILKSNFNFFIDPSNYTINN